METLHARCAGLDVHKDVIVACSRVQEEGVVDRSVESFGATVEELLRLERWLTEAGCTHVVMEATGVYWKPVWHVLDGSFELILANAAHVRNVPGRKTDINDAMWLADLLAHGLVRASFVPDLDTAQMRTLTRTRKQLVREQAQHVQRIQKVLEDANIKLSSVASDIVGLTGRRILDALLAGTTDPDVLLTIAGNRLKAGKDRLREALRGHFGLHHGFMIQMHLRVYDELQRAINEIDDEIGRSLPEHREAAELLTTMPGVGQVAAEVIVAEIGLDMSRFPTAGHLVSWAGLCPRADVSAGKRRSTRLKKGAPWLKTVLVQCAWAASRKKESYFRAKFLRLKARRGAMKAVCAIAASMLTAAYHMLAKGQTFIELGAGHVDRVDRARAKKRLVRRLEQLGFNVEIADLLEPPQLQVSS